MSQHWSGLSAACLCKAESKSARMSRWLKRLVPVISRYGVGVTLILSLVAGLSVSPRMFLVMMTPPPIGLVVIACLILDCFQTQRRHVHPEMLDVPGPLKYVLSRAINEGRTICGHVNEGRVTLYTLDQIVSIEAHPNLHAVNFLTILAVIVLQEERLPTDAELDNALRQSVRGKATMDTPIDWPGMKESFLLIGADHKAHNRHGMLKDLIASMAREVSSRLDQAIEMQASE